MADDNNTGTTSSATGDGGAGDGDTLGDAGKRALAAERRRATEAERKAADLEARVKELSDKDKPDIERLTGERDAAAKRAEEAERRYLVLEVATEKGLTPKQAARLTGKTRDELEADADELLTVFGVKKDTAGDGGKDDGGDAGSKDDQQQSGATPPSGRPAENLQGGSIPGATPEETDVRKLGERMFRR